MRIKSVELKRFKRFHHLKVELPENVRLVVLAGPNGSGKSSLFEAFHYWHEVYSGRGLNWDLNFYPKVGELDATTMAWSQQINLAFHQGEITDVVARQKAFYIRSAYRNDPQFELSNLGRQGSALEQRRFESLISNDAVVASNYQRLASAAL